MRVCAGVMVVIDCPSTLVYRGYMVDAVLAQTILRSKYVGPEDSAMWLGVETQVVLQPVWLGWGQVQCSDCTARKCSWARRQVGGCFWASGTYRGQEDYVFLGKSRML